MPLAPVWIASLFVFNKWLPLVISGALTNALSLTSVFLMLGSLRRELPVQRRPWQLYVVLAALHWAVLALLIELGQYERVGRAYHALLISGVDIYLIVVANRVRQQYQSRALWLVMGVFAAFVLSNLLRLLELWLVGRFSLLLDFTAVGNFALLVNYISVIIYCYGYWGFVVEKKRLQLVLAREAEKLSAEREELAKQTLRERTEWMDRLSLIGKQAQSGALSASIAHEVNQPLAAMQLNVEEAQRLAAECQAPEALQRLLERIEEDNQRAAETVRRVRSLFSQGQVRLQSLVLDNLVRFVTDMMKRRLYAEKVEVTLSLAAAAPFQCASGEVEHILMNLVENAIDALKSQPAEDRRIEVRTWQEPGWVMASVTDNGPGVPAEFQERIFELYQTSKPQGLGLGLWLAHYIVERHGGQLELDRQHAPGARFVMRLPHHSMGPAA